MGGDFNNPANDFNKPQEQVHYSPPPPPVQQLTEPVQEDFRQFSPLTASLNNSWL